MKHSRKMQRIHQIQVTRSIMADSGQIPSVADKYRQQNSAKPNSTDQSQGK